MVTFSFTDPSIAYFTYPIKEDRRISTSTVLGSDTDLVSYAKKQPVQIAHVLKRKVFDTGFIAKEVYVNGKPFRRIGAIFNDDGQRYQAFDLDEPEPYLEEMEEMDVEE
jgi:hypothetical protein